MTCSLKNLMKKMNFVFILVTNKVNNKNHRNCVFMSKHLRYLLWTVAMLRRVLVNGLPGWHHSEVVRAQQRPAARAHPSPRSRTPKDTTTIPATSLGLGQGKSGTKAHGLGSGSTKSVSEYKYCCSRAAGRYSWGVAQAESGSPIPPWNGSPGPTARCGGRP